MRPPTAREVIARRRTERQALIELARSAVESVAELLDVRAAVVVGSVARGDFHSASDVDLLVVAEAPPEDYFERLRAFTAAPSRVEPVVWTPQEYAVQCARRDPIAVEAQEQGVWLVGGPEADPAG